MFKIELSLALSKIHILKNVLKRHTNRMQSYNENPIIQIIQFK